jgi:hypothetical protein
MANRSPEQIECDRQRNNEYQRLYRARKRASNGLAGISPVVVAHPHDGISEVPRGL